MKKELKKKISRVYDELMKDGKLNVNLIMDYEKNFGPLRNFGSAYFENPDAWVSSPWPWENY